ncbi:uncharacterized protein A4U43_C06F7100 [Asparagus officinalis]|uniref:CASP-like protein n=1 Tax=Asparagus officinalis TaxID=4686 RepID=A0A5P1EKR8_ASPOF|nr:uncharacterized protein A4U43_C06F7100 [Asparagus officinalis]
MAKASKVCTLVLRLLAFAATATANETTAFLNITLEAKFQYTPAFKFFVVANAIGAVYSFCTLFIPPTNYLSRLVLASDMVITLLLTASVSKLERKAIDIQGGCQSVARWKTSVIKLWDR